MPEKERIKSCQARVEYLACKEAIWQLLNSGYAIKHAHRKLSESGKIKMSYRTLLLYVRKEKSKKDKGGNVNSKIIANKDNAHCVNETNLKENQLPAIKENNAANPIKKGKIIEADQETKTVNMLKDMDTLI